MKPAWIIGAFAALTLAATGTAKPLVSLSPGVRDDTGREALECFARGDYRTAARLYEQALKKAPDNVLVLSNLGVARFRLDELNGAVDVLERAAKLAPADVFVRCILGIVYYRQKRDAEAGEILRRAAELDSRNASVHRYLAWVYSRQGRADRVREKWGKIYKIELDAFTP